MKKGPPMVSPLISQKFEMIGIGLDSDGQRNDVSRLCFRVIKGRAFELDETGQILGPLSVTPPLTYWNGEIETAWGTFVPHDPLDLALVEYFTAP